MAVRPAREVLTIFLGGSEEVPGLSFYGLSSHAVEAGVLRFPQSHWPKCPEPESTLLHGEDWRVSGWDLHVAAWPTGEHFRTAIRATLQELINAGCGVAWVGAEGTPYCDPPDLFDPNCMTGGVLAWLIREGPFACPLDPDQPLAAASDEEMLQLRDRAGWLATTGEGTWSIRERVERIRAVVRSLADNLTEAEVREMQDLLDHDEWGAAFELLCTQLYEREWSATAPDLARLGEIAAALDLHPIELSLRAAQLDHGRDSGQQPR